MKTPHSIDCSTGRRLLSMMIAVAMALGLGSTSLFAATDELEWREHEDRRERGDHDWLENWSITGFVGQFDDSRFGEVISLRGWRFEQAYIGGLALNRKIGSWFDDMFHWEIEGSVFRHWGEGRHWEGNAAVVGRWAVFPWDHYVNTSLAFGQGVSLASRPPAVEGEDTRRFLNHLLMEVEAGPPHDSPWSVVARVHHRSGAFGLYGTRAGSNFMALGLRYRF